MSSALAWYEGTEPPTTPSTNARSRPASSSRPSRLQLLPRPALVPVRAAAGQRQAEPAGSAGRDLDELQDVAMPAHGGAGPAELLVAELGPHHSRRRQAGEPRTEHDGRVAAFGPHAAERVRGGRHQPIARPGSGGVSPVRRAKAVAPASSWAPS